MHFNMELKRHFLVFPTVFKAQIILYISARDVAVTSDRRWINVSPHLSRYREKKTCLTPETLLCFSQTLHRGA